MTSATTIRALSVATILVLSACVAEGYNGDDVNYYEPYYDPGIGIYGSWGPDYRVGPYRRGDWDGARGGGQRGDGRGYHPAPAGRSPPSIPSAPRSHGSGGRPGGGGQGGGRPGEGHPR
jgi:hypothetical protein